MSTLARLTFYKNLLIGQETSVRCLHYWVSVLSGLNLEKCMGSPWGQGKLSVRTGCPYLVGVCNAGSTVLKNKAVQEWANFVSFNKQQ